MASAPATSSFFSTALKISGAGLDASASSDEVDASRRSVMPARSRYTLSSCFFADDATAARRCRHWKTTVRTLFIVLLLAVVFVLAKALVRVENERYALWLG